MNIKAQPPPLRILTPTCSVPSISKIGSIELHVLPSPALLNERCCRLSNIRSIVSFALAHLQNDPPRTFMGPVHPFSYYRRHQRTRKSPHISPCLCTLSSKHDYVGHLFLSASELPHHKPCTPWCMAAFCPPSLRKHASQRDNSKTTLSPWHVASEICRSIKSPTENSDARELYIYTSHFKPFFLSTWSY